MWAARVLQIKLCNYFSLLRQYRRACASAFQAGKKGDWDIEVSLWESSVAQLRAWCSIAVANIPRPVLRRDGAAFLLYTDSSLEGYGYQLHELVSDVVFDAARAPLGHKYSEELEAFLAGGGGFWRPDEAEHITVLEAKAVVLALHFFGDVLRGQSIVLAIDNTALMGALGRGWSNSWRLNEVVRQITAAALSLGITITEVVWVASADNFADSWSRGQGFSGPSLASERRSTL